MRTRTAGYSLVEVMIAVAILSAGLLAVAAAQILGLRNNTGSYLRSQAALFAQDLADRMRTNYAEANAGSYRSTTPSTAPSNPGYDCQSGTCTASQLASADLYLWYTAASAILPSFKFSVDCAGYNAAATPSCPINTVHELQVMWDDTRTGVPTGTGCDPTNTSTPPQASDDLYCYRLRFNP